METQDKFVNIGNCNLLRELFSKVKKSEHTMWTKPSGGLWLSDYLDDDLSSWVKYKKNRDWEDSKISSDASIISLKKDARIIEFNNEKIIKEIAEFYPSIQKLLQNYEYRFFDDFSLIDYYKLAFDYDGVYLDFESLPRKLKNCEFDSWGCNTLLLFNLDCIELYKSASVVNSNGNYFLGDISQNKFIESVITGYLELCSIGESYFESLLDTSNLYDSISYSDYEKSLLNLYFKLKSFLNYDCKKEILEIKKELNIDNSDGNYCPVIESISSNIYADKLYEDEEYIRKFVKNVK